MTKANLTRKVYNKITVPTEKPLLSGTLIPMPRTLPCVQPCHCCGEDYTASSYNSKYCDKCKTPMKLLKSRESRKRNNQGPTTCPICGKGYKKVTSNKWCPTCAPAQRRLRRKIRQAEYHQARGMYRGQAPPEECWRLLVERMVESCRGDERCPNCTVQMYCDKAKVVA